MKHMNVQTRTYLFIFFLIVCYTYSSYGQIIKKDTIFLVFKKNDKILSKEKCLKFKRKEGVIFNLCKKGSFLFKNTSKSDTLCYKHIKDYKITNIDSIAVLEKKWKIKSRKALIKKYGKIYPPFDKNGIFQTYLIEQINNKQLVVYPVIWRNEGVVE